MKINALPLTFETHLINPIVQLIFKFNYKVMKKSLLLLASALMSLASFAQSFTATWEKPTVTDFVDMADDGETTQFLWNVGAKGFLVGHNDYNTRASVADYGDSIRMVALYQDEEPTGTWNLGCYPAKYTNKNKWLYVSANAWDAQWVDASNATANGSYPGTDGWMVEKQENGSYKFTNTAVDADPGTWGVAESCKGESPNTRCYFYDSTYTYVPVVEEEEQPEELAFSGEFWDEWKFVSVETYKAYVEKMTIYDAAANLKKQIEAAEKKGISTANLADEYAVYNNLNSTLEELTNAAASAYDKGRWTEIAQYFEDVVQGEKNDVSGVFVNNDFSAGNANGWDITYTGNSTEATNIGYQNNASYSNGDVQISGFIEAWKNTSSPNYLGDGSITQTIPGLPAGKYMLAVDVIANNQGRISDASNPDGLPDDVQLFAKASLDGKEYFTPMATKNGKPEHFEFTFVHTGGSMTLGLRVIGSAEATMPANWIAMDNLQLFYYGEVTEDPDKVLLDDLVEKTLESYPIEALDELVAYTGDKDAYKTAIEAAQAATEDYTSYSDQVTAAVKALEASIAAYAKLAAKAEEWVENINDNPDLNSDEWQAYSDFAQNVDTPEGYPEATPATVREEQNLSATEVETYIQTVDSLFKEAVAKSLQPGDDCTKLLTNASFADGFTGWTNYTGTFGGLKDYPCVEVYESKVDCYQVLTGVPDGVYSLYCQAFFRPGGTYDKDTPSKVFLYMNDYQTPVQNILMDALPEAEAEDKVNCFISGGNPDEDFYSTGGTTNKDVLSAYGYIPNGMSGASYAFRANRYNQKVFGLVEGGTMKIGLTSNDETLGSGGWVLWSQFKLIYEGKGSDATAIMLEEYIGNLQEYMDENSDNFSPWGDEQANAAIDAANAALESGDEEEMTAAITNVQDALTAAKANVAAYTAYEEAFNAMDNAYNEFANEASESAKAAYDEVMAKAADVDDLTTDELVALTEEMTEVAAALKVPAYEDATDENPIDMTRVIVNNSFEEGLTGWTYYKGSDTQAADNSNSTYTIYNADGNYVFNTWSGSAPAEGFWVAQTINNLPAGTYELQALLASDMNNTIGLTAANGGADFVMENAKETGMEASIFFKLAEGEELEIKAFSKTWFKADNFRLFYYGTESQNVVTDVAAVELPAAAAPSAIYSISGARLNGLQKGLNIVKFSNGTVKKVFVK